MTVRKIKSIGDIPYPIDVGTDALSPLLTAGAALGITGNDAEESAWLARTSDADGVVTIRSIHGNTVVQDGALVPVNMTGIESTAADESWTQQRTIPAGTLRSAGTVYDELTETERIVRVGVVDLGTLTWVYDSTNAMFYATLTSMMAAARFDNILECATYGSYPSDTIANLASNMPDKAISTRATYAHLYAKDSAYTDATTFKAAMSGVMLHYALATPVTTPIDPPLNMTYRTEQGGTERVMVPSGENSAPPTLVTAQGYTAESLRDAALATIAPVENGLASTNYGIGSYLIHGGQLCRVTTAIATGEAISIGTNVTATTVMAEVIALTQ